MSAEAQVSQAAGQDGTAALRGGGAGVVEREAGAVSGADIKMQATGAARHEEIGARHSSELVSDSAVSTSGYRDPASEVARAEQLEFNQRDQAIGKVRGVEDRHDEARRITNDPRAVGSEKAEYEASLKMSEASPVDVDAAEAKANVATGAVQNPRGVAQGQVDASISAQEREAEVKLGVSGSAEASRGTPPTGNDDGKA